MEIARFWRFKKERYRLTGSNCPSCEIVHFPPRRICPDCGHDNQKPVESPIKSEEVSTSIDVFVAGADSS